MSRRKFTIRRAGNRCPRPWKVGCVRPGRVPAIWHAAATHAEAVAWLDRLMRGEVS